MIMLTDKAVKEIKRLQEADASAQGKPLRVQVVGGGCSGMSYKLGFDNEPTNELDKTFEKDGISLIVDNKSYLFITGTELDFSDGLNGKGFVFNNPNAKRSCGCGSSFST